MMAQNDCNKILNQFYFLQFFPGCQEKLKNGKNVIFNPKMAKKIENFLKSAIFHATNLNDSSKWPQ